MKKIKTFTILIIICLLGAAIIGLTNQNYSCQKELEITKNVVRKQQNNQSVLIFTKLFVEKVLQAEQEVDFETRLKLENGVRDLGDAEILAEWEKFINSEDAAEAQKTVKDLLQILVNKIGK